MTKEIQQILRAYDDVLIEGRQAALATVVHVDGSSYRRPGARMLIEDNGQLTGAISGGCLEGDALRKALLVMTERKSRLVTYDTSDEDDAIIGTGLGCNGIIQVLIEPIDSADPLNPIYFLQRLTAGKQKSVLVTLFSLDDRQGTQYGTSLLLLEDETFIHNKATFSERLENDIRDAMFQKQSVFKKYSLEGKEVTAFLEIIDPPVNLVIFGGGYDVIPVVDMAALLGWESVVIDGRPAFAKKDRFVNACQVILSKPEDVLEKISINVQTYFLLMTHNYNYDKAMLAQLLKRDVTYIGLLGPKTKKERILRELAESGLGFSENDLLKLYGPMGLDIGAETPEEIALSIIAEIQACFAGKAAQSLRKLETEIHSRSSLKIND